MEEVIEDEGTMADEDPVVVEVQPDLDKRHRHRMRVALVILAIVLIPTLIFAAYPRMEVEVRLWYAEGFGSISVDMEIANVGRDNHTLKDCELPPSSIEFMAKKGKTKCSSSWLAQGRQYPLAHVLEPAKSLSWPKTT